MEKQKLAVLIEAPKEMSPEEVRSLVETALKRFDDYAEFRSEDVYGDPEAMMELEYERDNIGRLHVARF